MAMMKSINKKIHLEEGDPKNQFKNRKLKNKEILFPQMNLKMKMIID